jgi:hypothetical protein
MEEGGEEESAEVTGVETPQNGFGGFGALNDSEDEEVPDKAEVEEKMEEEEVKKVQKKKKNKVKGSGSVPSAAPTKAKEKQGKKARAVKAEPSSPSDDDLDAILQDFSVGIDADAVGNGALRPHEELLMTQEMYLDVELEVAQTLMKYCNNTMLPLEYYFNTLNDTMISLG